MMSLYLKERKLVAFWNRESGSGLPADVEVIMLTAKALDSSRGYVSLSYEFTNMDACIAEGKRDRDAGL
jgi:hypothetical protein